MRVFRRTDSEVLQIPSTFTGVADGHDTVLDTEGDWGLSDIPPPSEIDVHSSLQADFIIFR